MLKEKFRVKNKSRNNERKKQENWKINQEKSTFD